MSFTEQYVTDTKGKPVAVLMPIKQYNYLLEQLEDLADIRAYKKAKKAKSEWLSVEEAFSTIEKKKR